MNHIQIMPRYSSRWFAAAFFCFLACCCGTTLAQSNSTGLAMHGSPKESIDFSHFPYVNPNAPRNGKISYGVVGTFDGLNPFVITSVRTTARGLFGDQQFGNMVFESLMTRSRDEPFTLYPLIAQRYQLNDERSEMIIWLDPKARFSDGLPVTADDIIFSFDLLKNKGRPPFNQYIQRINTIEKLDAHSIKFTFNRSKDREFPLILLSLIPVLPQHAIDVEKFEQNGLTVISGTGPYTIATVKPGQRIVYKRNPDYWGADLAVNRGLNNFETVTIEYYRNDNARFEAFKKGLLDVFIEENPNRWRIGYNFPAVQDGRVIKEHFNKTTPANMVGFVFNTRRTFFADPTVRQALALVFDFEWTNRNLFNNSYKRIEGFWAGSPLSSIGIAASQREKSLLSPFPGRVSAEVMNGTWHAPKTDASGMDRHQLNQAWKLLTSKGFIRRGGITYLPDGKPFQFEIMTQTTDEEKVALAFQRRLQYLGIAVTVRTVDDTQYQNRLSSFDYDMIVGKLSASLSPGNEQINRFASISRDIEGSFNYSGAHDPAIDAMIDAMRNARSQEDFIAAVHALDRLLISGNYFIPLYYLPDQYVARWSYIHHPQYTSAYGFWLPSWWRDNQTP